MLSHRFSEFFRGKIMTVENAVTIARSRPYPPQKGQCYRCKLDILHDVLRQMARVYRECRSDLLDPATTDSKLTYML